MTTHPVRSDDKDLEKNSEPVAAENFLREIFFDTGDSILFVDSGYRILEANTRAMEIHGLPYEQIIGSDCRVLVDPADRPALLHAFQGLTGQESWKGEIKGVRGDHHVFPISITIKHLPLADRSIFCLVIRDRSEVVDLQNLLRQEKAQRRELYITLRNLMKAYEKEKQGLEGGISHKIETVLLPAIEKVRNEVNTEIRNSYLYIMREQLINLTKGFSRELEGRFLKLTRSEIRVCQLIQEGHSTKEIAHRMNVSFETVQVHRRNIRKKLGLQGRKVNLYNLLSSRPLFQTSSVR